MQKQKYAYFLVLISVCINVLKALRLKGAMETPHNGKASKKRTHKTILMSSSIDSKLKRLYSKDSHRNGRSAWPPSLS